MRHLCLFDLHGLCSSLFVRVTNKDKTVNQAGHSTQTILLSHEKRLSDEDRACELLPPELTTITRYYTFGYFEHGIKSFI